MLFWTLRIYLYPYEFFSLLSTMSDTNTLENTNLTPEEILWPPRVDMSGVGLIIFLSLVTWLIVGGMVFMMVYFSFGDFLFQSGASAILIAMFVFLALAFWNTLFVWGLSNIFPHIYSSARTIYLQVSVYSVLLYIVMSIAYFSVGILFPKTSALLMVYAIHIIINMFGIFLLTGILSQYRYAILTFYSSIVSLVIMCVGTLYLSVYLGESSRILFLFIWFPSVIFFVGTGTHFLIGWIYHELYTLSGADPFGSLLRTIENEEKELERNAEKKLFIKK